MVRQTTGTKGDEGNLTPWILCHAVKAAYAHSRPPAKGRFLVEILLAFPRKAERINPNQRNANMCQLVAGGAEMKYRHPEGQAHLAKNLLNLGLRPLLSTVNNANEATFYGCRKRWCDSKILQNCVDIWGACFGIYLNERIYLHD